MTRKVVHVITGLELGGAETALYKLLAHCDRACFDPAVVSLTDHGPIGDRIRQLGIPVFRLGIDGPFSVARGVARLIQRLRAIGPDLVQTWMYHADLLGGLAALFANKVPVVWGIRQSNLDPKLNKRTTMWVAKVCASLSGRLPTAVIACSRRAREAHLEFGYVDPIEVIPNGFDLQLFRPDPVARNRVRATLGVPSEALLIGLVARFDPQKDHKTFVHAGARVARRYPDAQFLFCGEGATGENTQLSAWLRDAGVVERCHLLGRRVDMPAINAALDISVSSSAGEGFSNAIGEAMCCAVPCVVTDVGDSAEVVGETGRIVAPHDQVALADAIVALIELGAEGRRHLGAMARCRISELYDIGQIARRYEKTYLEIIDNVRDRRSF